MKDDPARHERLAAIGKNGAPIRLHKKDDVLFRVSFLLGVKKTKKGKLLSFFVNDVEDAMKKK